MAWGARKKVKILNLGDHVPTFYSWNIRYCGSTCTWCLILTDQKHFVLAIIIKEVPEVIMPYLFQGTAGDIFWWHLVWQSWYHPKYNGDEWEEYDSAWDGTSCCWFCRPLRNSVAKWYVTATVLAFFLVYWPLRWCSRLGHWLCSSLKA